MLGVWMWLMRLTISSGRIFVRQFLAKNPDLYILGEVWHTSQPWLNGDEFHAVMNYPLSDSIKDYFLRGIRRQTSSSMKSMESLCITSSRFQRSCLISWIHMIQSESCGRPMKMFNWLNQP